MDGFKPVRSYPILAPRAPAVPYLCRAAAGSRARRLSPSRERPAPGTPPWSRRSPRALCPVPGERELKGSKRAARCVWGCGQGVDAGFALPGAAGAFPAPGQCPCALPQPGMLLGADFLPGPLCDLSHGRFIALSCPGQGEFWGSRVQGDCGLCLSLKGGKVLEHLLQNCLSPLRQEGLT